MNLPNVRKPNFVIIGSAKCGTTALASILANHPDCCFGIPKEVCFFQDTIDSEPNPNYEKGWDWYRQAFAHYQGEPVVGEATPAYSDRSRSPNTAARIHEFDPDMKLIYMVRDPWERQISAWKMQWAEGKSGVFPDRPECQWALEGFEYWLQAQKGNGQVETCRYAWQLESYERLFPSSQILISFLEDWKDRKEKEVCRIMKFIGLDPDRYDFQYQERTNSAAGRKTELPILQKMKQSSAIRSLARIIPKSTREKVMDRFGRSVARPPQPTCSESVKRDFCDYVRQDYLSILEREGRPPVWKNDLVSP